jgi:hypothetical protein
MQPVITHQWSDIFPNTEVIRTPGEPCDFPEEICDLNGRLFHKT